MKKTSLEKIAREKGIPLGRGNKNKDDIIKLIIKPSAAQVLANNGNGNNECDLSPLVQLLHQSFLRLQSNDVAREEAATGHDNEEPFIKAFCDICFDEYDNNNDNEFSKTSVSAVYRPGLVKKKAVFLPKIRLMVC